MTLACFLFLAAPFSNAQEMMLKDGFETGSTVIGRVLDTNAFVEDEIELGVEGAVISILGDTASTVTDADGNFSLSAIPSGHIILDIDTDSATPAPNGAPYAGFREAVMIDPGTNMITRPLYLPRIDMDSLTTINPGATTVVSNPNLGIDLVVTAGNARDEFGNPFSGQMSISEVPGALAPAALPDFLEPGLLVTIQPVGVFFDQPAPITWSNTTDNLTPGSETDLWSLDPEQGIFVVVGTGQVSPDGTTIENLTGGIRAADWHMPMPPRPKRKKRNDDPPDCDGCCPSCAAGIGSSVDLFSGELTEHVNLPAVYSLSQRWAPQLVYRSRRASPQYFMPVDMEIVSRASVPEVIYYQNYVEGEAVDSPIYVDTSTLVGGTDEPFRVSAPLDASSLETGLYDVNTRVTASYVQTDISENNVARLSVINEADSPFGAGWSLSGLDRIIPDESGAIRENLLLVKGDGGSIQFEENLTGINPDGIISIVIRQNTSCCWDGETGALMDILDDLGHDSQLIVGAELTQDVIDESRMIVWMDFSFVNSAASTIWQDITAVLLEAKANGMPMFFIGSELANFTQASGNEEFIEDWLSLVHLNLASSSSGGQGMVTVIEPDHPVFDGPAGSLTEFVIGNDSDVTRGSNTGETVLAESATADIVLVAESEAGGRTAVLNSTYVSFQPNENEDELEIIIRNAIPWLLDSPSVASGFFGENNFAAVDGEFSGIIRDPGPGTFTRFLKGGGEQHFDATGRLTTATDRNGNTFSYSYDGNGRLETITDPASRVTTLAYDGNGKLQTITDAASRVTQFTVDGNGDLVEVEYPDTTSRTFTYDVRHQLMSQTNREMETTTYTFDDFGFLTESLQPDGSTRQTSAAQAVGLVDTTGGMGTEGNPAPVTRPPDFGSAFMDPLGRTLEADTGPFGEPLGVMGPDGLETIFERNAGGGPVVYMAPNGSEMNFSYDSRGNRTQITDVLLGGSWKLGYESEFNLVTTVTDPLDNTYTIGYDAEGNVTSITSPEGRTVSNTNTAAGLPDTLTASNGTVTQFTYNPQGLATQVDEGSGLAQRTTTVTHLASGEVETVTDPESRLFTYAYDLDGRPTSLTLPDTETVAATWDDQDNLTEIVPPGQPAHNFTFTEFGALASYEPPAVGGLTDTSYTYNLAQQLEQVDRPDGRSVVMTYDSSGRLETRQIARATFTVSYDGATGEIASISDTSGESLAFSYVGWRLSGQSWTGTISGDFDRSFNNRGLMASDSVNGGNSVSYSYDDDGFLTQAGLLQITRDTATPDIASTTLGVVSDTYTFDEFGALESYEASVSGSPVYSFDFVRDKLGRITSETETIGGVATDYDYTYHARGWLDQVDVDTVLAADYSYDANGNRTQRDDGVIMETGSHDDQDRLTSYDGITYTYRQSGELLTRTDGMDVTTYDYDELGNLLSVELPSGTEIEYVIDANERRIGRKVNGTLTQGWLYRDALNPIAELDGAGVIVSRFVYGTKSNVPDYMVTGGDTYRLITDQVGSVRLVIDTDTGSVAQRLDYDEFGRVLMDTNPGFQPFGFAGGMYDPATGLVRFGARDYDPQTGRWTAKDPIIFAGGDTNLYVYAFNNPLARTDPDGMNPQPSNRESAGAPPDLTPAAGPDPVARVYQLKGEEGKTFVIRADGTIEAAYIEQKLFVGDKIRTNALAYANIQFYTGTQVQINKNTKVCITSDEEVEVDRSHETWRARLQRALRPAPTAGPGQGYPGGPLIRSSSGVMGIRG